MHNYTEVSVMTHHCNEILADVNRTLVSQVYAIIIISKMAYYLYQITLYKL